MTASEGHPDELLSAHVDGELDAETSAWVEDHLEGCAPCREAEAELRRTSELLRTLPTVDAAPVIEGFLARHRAVIRLGAGFVAVAALVLVALALNAATYRRPMVPDVEQLVAAHVEESHADMADVERDQRAPYAAPPGLIGTSVSLSRHEIYDGTDLGVGVYRDDDVVVTVYEQPGRLDWDELPAGDVATMAGRPVWFRTGTPIVAVTEKGDAVVTVVSDDRAAVLTAVGSMPAWRRSTTWDRVHDACQRLTQVFALEG